AEAWRIGLVHELCEADELDARINGLLGSFMVASPDTLAQAKGLISDLAGRPIDAALLDDTTARLAAQRAADDGREGIAAFLEKRAPRWVPTEQQQGACATGWIHEVAGTQRVSDTCALATPVSG